MFKYLLKNLKSFRKNERIIYILVIVCVFVSSIMISFSYGIYRNYLSEKEAQNYQLTQLQIKFTEDSDKGDVTKEKLDRCLLRFSEELDKKIDCFLITARVNEDMVTECRFTIKNGKFSRCDVFKENMIKGDFLKVYFTQEQEETGQAVMLIYNRRKYETPAPATDKIKRESGFAQLQGKSFEIIGTQRWLVDSVLIPYAALAEDTTLMEKGLSMSFTSAITEQQYEEITEIFQQELGDLASIPPMGKSDISSEDIYNTMIVLAVLIAIVAAVNLAILFLYVLAAREREFGIFLICGLNRNQITRLYLLECAVLCIPVFISGLVAYNWMILPIMQKSYLYMAGIYSISIYITMFFIYFFVTSLILVCAVMKHINRQSIKDFL